MAQFNDKVEPKDFTKMPKEYQDLLTRLLTIQADCEIGGPHLYVEDMIGGAPGRTNQIVVARTAAEEIDHFRKMAFMAGQKDNTKAVLDKVAAWQAQDVDAPAQEGHLIQTYRVRRSLGSTVIVRSSTRGQIPIRSAVKPLRSRSRNRSSIPARILMLTM